MPDDTVDTAVQGTPERVNAVRTELKRLVVVVPGIRFGFKGWELLLQRLKAEPQLAGAQWLLWEHGSSWYSVASAAQLSVDLRARIDQEWSARGPFDDIILVGYSLGALLTRQAFLLAKGADALTRRESEWAKRVSRIILFAGINRGVDTERHPLVRWFARLARLFPPFRYLLTWDLLRGSDFIANLRIQWIRHFRALEDHAPVVVQLLGTKDTIVSNQDSIDVEQFPTGYYIEIPNATHNDLHRLDLTEDPDGRYALFRDAFVHRTPELAENRQFSGPSAVVFVVHGIRADNKTWVEQTADTIRKRWPQWEVIRPPYPYVSALRFAIPMLRRRRLEWFQDAYTEALALNPAARFAFIGHSNGTYLFGESLRRLPGMKFERAVLVGSVLPSEYDWKMRVNFKQLGELRVDGSSYDWPVAWLCNALRGLGMRDIGTAGYVGFTKSPHPKTTEYFWHDGGHSAPLAAHNLPSLVESALGGNPPRPSKLRPEAKWFSIVSRSFPLLGPILVLGLPSAAIAAWAFGHVTLATAFVTAFVLLIGVLAII